jgi:hypothetical protein
VDGELIKVEEPSSTRNSNLLTNVSLSTPSASRDPLLIEEVPTPSEEVVPPRSIRRRNKFVIEK